jgi:tRNA-dihydrouridine synthase A
VEDFLQNLDGVMIGREAYQNPFFLNGVDKAFFNKTSSNKKREDYLIEYLPYIEKELKLGTPLKHMTRHLLGLFRGEPGGKNFRRYLTENSSRKDAGTEVVQEALQLVRHRY